MHIAFEMTYTHMWFKNLTPYFRVLLRLAANLWDRNVPLMVCRCYGFIGYMRLAVREHTGRILLFIN